MNPTKFSTKRYHSYSYEKAAILPRSTIRNPPWKHQRSKLSAELRHPAQITSSRAFITIENRAEVLHQRGCARARARTNSNIQRRAFAELAAFREECRWELSITAVRSREGDKRGLRHWQECREALKFQRPRAGGLF